MNGMSKRKNTSIALTIIFSILLIVSGNMLTSFMGGKSSNQIVFGQSNQSTVSSNKLVDVYKIPIQKAAVGDIEIAYKAFGNGTNTILLISGGSNTMNFWDAYLLNELAKNNTVIVFDSRGIGNTTSGDKPFSIKQFANDTAGLIDAIGVTSKVDIIGFSLGSLVAQEVAYMYQDKVNHLILYGSMCGGKDAIPPSAALQNFTNALQNPDRTNNTSDNETYSVLDDVLFPPKWMLENPDYLIKIPRQGVSINASDATKLLGAFMSWTQTESCDKLSDIQVPTLVIVGTEDSVTSPGNSLNLVDGIPGAWLVQIKDGGHGVMFQYPEVFTNAVKLFLDYSATL
jgi:pimeloyl-ACP methyl ester carboxylesterase